MGPSFGFRNVWPFSQTAFAVIQGSTRARHEFGKEKDASAIPVLLSPTPTAFKERHSFTSSTGSRLHISVGDSVQDCSTCLSTGNHHSLTIVPNCFSPQLEVSNSDQLFFLAWTIMKLETSTSTPSF